MTDMTPSERQAFALLGPLEPLEEYSLSSSDLVSLQKDVVWAEEKFGGKGFLSTCDPSNIFEDLISRLFWPCEPTIEGE